MSKILEHINRMTRDYLIKNNILRIDGVSDIALCFIIFFSFLICLFFWLQLLMTLKKGLEKSGRSSDPPQICS